MQNEFIAIWFLAAVCATHSAAVASNSHHSQHNNSHSVSQIGRQYGRQTRKWKDYIKLFSICLHLTLFLSSSTSLSTLSEAICALLRLPFERNTSIQDEMESSYTRNTQKKLHSAFDNLRVGESLDAIMTNEKYVLFSKRILSVCTHALAQLSHPLIHARAHCNDTVCFINKYLCYY